MDLPTERRSELLRLRGEQRDDLALLRSYGIRQVVDPQIDGFTYPEELQELALRREAQVHRAEAAETLAAIERFEMSAAVIDAVARARAGGYQSLLEGLEDQLKRDHPSRANLTEGLTRYVMLIEIADVVAGES